MASFHKTKGSNFERKIIAEINDLDCGYSVGSARLHSRYMDNMKVDIVDTPLSINKFPYHIQCKSITGYPKYNELLKEFQLKDRPLIIFHEMTEKRGTRFYKIGDYVILKKEDFYKIIKNLKL